MAALLGLAAPLLGACGSTPERSITGVWTGEGEAGAGTSLTLRDDGSARWVLDASSPAGAPDTRYALDARYALDDSTTPYRLDLFGFESGPLAGLTLYGIAELPDPDTLRFDCDPGPAGGDGSAVRPAGFTRETVTYRRAR